MRIDRRELVKEGYLQTYGIKELRSADYADYTDWKGNRELGGGMVDKRYYVHPQALDYADYTDYAELFFNNLRESM